MYEIIEENKKHIIVIGTLILLTILFLIFTSCSSNKYISTSKTNGKSKLPYIKINDSEFKQLNKDFKILYNQIVDYKNESYFTYEYNVSDNIFSLLIIKSIRENNEYFSNEEYSSYIYDLKAKEFYSQEEILNKYNLTYEKIDEKILNSLKKQYQKEIEKGYLDLRECKFSCFLEDKNYTSARNNVILYVKDNTLYGYLNINNGSLYYDVNDYPKTKKIYKLN